MVNKVLEDIESNYPPEQRDLLIKAYNFAKKAHEGQKRQSGEDYFIHPCAVSEILIELKLDYETVAAAFLHDVIEDTPYTSEELEAEFGKTVVMLVNGVTKLDRLQFKSKEEEQAENLRKMLFAMSDDIRVIIIKLADRLHNMRTLHFRPEDKQKITARETLDIYAPIAARLGMGTIKGELEDLSMRYLIPDEYYALVQKVASKKSERKDFVDKIVKQIQDKLQEMKIEGEVNGRPKHFYSIYRKIKAGKEFEQIYDLIAVRIIVGTVKDCYAVLGAIHTMWKPFPGRFKDYIAMPKPNGYQSIHTTVITQYGSPFEIQIRTAEMHAVAEYGIAAHWKYKEGRNTATQSIMDERVGWLRDMLETQKDAQDNSEFLQTIKMDLYPDEVFVLTPKGDVVNLPRGATGVDFAYSVHSEVGNKCVGIKVDGKIVPLNTRLENNTIVEVMTSANSRGPSLDWLKFAVTPSARSKIRQFFKREQREENIKRGKDLLEREAKRRGYVWGELISTEEGECYIKDKLGYDDLDDMYAELGYGNFTTNKIIPRLIDLFKSHIAKTNPVVVNTPIQGKKPVKKGDGGILIDGSNDFLVRLSHCCNPVPGDKIVGYVSHGRGVSIHRADCPNVKGMEPERLIAASWPEELGHKFTAQLEITCVNRSNFILDVSMLLSNMHKQITKLNARIVDAVDAIIELEVEIDDIADLEDIMSKLKGISGVKYVYRK